MDADWACEPQGGEGMTTLTLSRMQSSVRDLTFEIAKSNLDTFLTPSSIAAELRPDLEPAEAANIYTGVVYRFQLIACSGLCEDY